MRTIFHFGLGVGLFLALLFPLSTFAHLDAGVDRVVGNYLVDFGYAPEHIVAGTSTSLAFNLVTAKTEEIVPFTSVWVRISTGDQILFAGTLTTEAQHVVFNFVFPNAGTYDVTARYQDGEQHLLEQTFPLTVVGPAERSIRETAPMNFWARLSSVLWWWMW